MDLTKKNITTLYLAEKLWEEVFYDNGPGFESEKIKYSYPCKNCDNKNLDINFSDFISNSIYNFKRDYPKSFNLLKELSNLKITNSLDLEIIKTINGFSAYFTYKKCENCGLKYLFIIGFGEMQPTRYIAHIQSIHIIKD